MIDLTDSRYEKIIDYIKELYYENEIWDDVFNLTKFKGITNENQILGFIKINTNFFKDLDKSLWIELVDEVRKQIDGKKLLKMGTNVRNDAKLPMTKSSAWQTYKSKLIKDGWTRDSIDNLEFSAYDMLQNLTMNSALDGSVKGLAIGNVQSGKTANMVALMAMAADNGFNYFVVLSGVIENLRKQTSDRLYNDLNHTNHNIQWKPVHNPSLKSNLVEHNLSAFQLNDNSQTAYYSVVLKNATRLNNFVKWLLNADPNKTKQLKILIIDDEADQASINTKDIFDEEENPTTISRLVGELVNTSKVKAMNYIAYTATPYANILNDASPKSLYPKDFIVMLETNPEYIGPEQMFSIQEPESQPNIDIVREIPKEDRRAIIEINKGNINTHIPSSFQDAIIWFLLSVSAMRSLDLRKPISMLVHTSFKIDAHQFIADKINSFLFDVYQNYEEYKPLMKKRYETERRYFSRKHFLEGMQSYSHTKMVPEYPAWEEVEGHLDLIMDLDETKYLSHIPVGEEGQPTYHHGIHLVIDNSKSKAEDQIVRLVYPQKNQLPNLAPAFIVIGGNTLSRGLTIEGLTSTYFLRDTSQADTLMQMGRWFGYRKGYELFPRVWLDKTGRERFEFLAQLNSELREEVDMYSVNGMSPMEYAIKVKNSPSRNFMRITANNKQQSAIAGDYDFTGYNVQTIYYEENVEKLKSNLNLTTKFLNSLNKPIINGSKMLWKNASHEAVREYLNKYKACESDKKMASLQSMLNWIEENNNNPESAFTDWNVLLSSTGEVEKTYGVSDEWNIHGYSPRSVARTKLVDRSTEEIANIGALRAPIDLVSDIELSESEKRDFSAKMSNVFNLRRKYQADRTPLLMIYKIDKNGGEITDKRERLDFPEDLIGISILMPGFSTRNVPITNIHISLPEIDISSDEEGS